MLRAIPQWSGPSLLWLDQVSSRDNRKQLRAWVTDRAFENDSVSDFIAVAICSRVGVFHGRQIASVKNQRVRVHGA